MLLCCPLLSSRLTLRGSSVRYDWSRHSLSGYGLSPFGGLYVAMGVSSAEEWETQPATNQAYIFKACIKLFKKVSINYFAQNRSEAKFFLFLSYF